MRTRRRGTVPHRHPAVILHLNRPRITVGDSRFGQASVRRPRPDSHPAHPSPVVLCPRCRVRLCRSAITWCRGKPHRPRTSSSRATRPPRTGHRSSRPVAHHSIRRADQLRNRVVRAHRLQAARRRYQARINRSAGHRSNPRTVPCRSRRAVGRSRRLVPRHSRVVRIRFRRPVVRAHRLWVVRHRCRVRSNRSVARSPRTVRSRRAVGRSLRAILYPFRVVRIRFRRLVVRTHSLREARRCQVCSSLRTARCRGLGEVRRRFQVALHRSRVI